MPPSTDPLPRERLGPYRLVRRLGLGGMGETYEAESAGGDRVCLKTIRPDLAGEARYVRMFEDEMRIHAQLRDEHIVRVLDTGEAGGTPFLVLEMVSGMSLQVLLAYLSSRGEQAPPPAIAHILLGLSAALHAAHTFAIRGKPQNIVHRDVSPCNVLLGRGGEVKLSDFGIAKTLTRAPHTTAGMVRGKFAYMSPEQTRGEPIDHRSDLFSLGVIAYELMTGTHPFRAGRDENEVMTAHRMLLGERVPLGRRAPWVPAALLAATERLLEPDPSARPYDALTFARALSEESLLAESGATLARLVARALPWARRGAAESAAQVQLPTEPTPERSTEPPISSVAPRPARPAADLLGHYLAGLPAGFHACSSCKAKGSLVRAYLASKPLVPDPAWPPGLIDIVTHPPVSGAWVSEVSFLSIALLVRAQHFQTDGAFLAWVKELNAELFRGPLYRALMLVSSPRLLAAGAPLRWRQFHEGTTLSAEYGDDDSLDLSFRFPTGLFTPLHVRLFAAAIEAAVEAAGGASARTAYAETRDNSARVLIRWG